MSKRLISVAEGCAAALKRLSPRVPDAFFFSGLTAFGVGVWQFDHRAVWLYAGATLVWLAFGFTESAKAGDR